MSVPDLLADARAYTADLADQASAAMDEAIELVRAVGYTIPNYFPATLPAAPVSEIDLTAPVLDPVNLDLPVEPSGSPVYQDISPLELLALPELTASAPTISLPSRPSQVAEFLTAAPGIDTNIAFPEPPDALINPVFIEPVIADRAEPQRPTIALPSLDATAPVDNVVVPTDYETRFAAAYRDAAPSTIAMVDGYVDAQLLKINPQFHVQMAALEAQLSTYLAGGTGLSTDVEDALYERMRDKMNAEAGRVRDAAYSEAADLGFTLPSGALAAAVQQARQAGADNNARASVEIAVQQAEMEQKNLQFAVTTSVGLRTVALNASLNYMQNLVTINGQALEYAKGVLSAIVEVFNTAVKAYGYKLDAYRAETVVYEVRLKAAMSYIELYKAEIDALQALTVVDRARVDVYRAKIEALTAVSNVYRAQIEAVQGRVSLEKLQLDVFQAQVQAHGAYVQGKTAEWQGYAAAIEGEVAQVKMYGAQVEAYNAQLTGYRSVVEAGSERVRAQALTNQARATNYAATLSGYAAVVDARAKKATVTMENQRQTILAYTAQVQAEIGNAQVQQEYYRSFAQIAVANAGQRMTAQVETGNSTRAFGETLAKLGNSNAVIFGNLAGSALSGMNSLAAETLAS